MAIRKRQPAFAPTLANSSRSTLLEGEKVGTCTDVMAGGFVGGVLARGA
jgi:hypothetical protein